MQVVVVLTIKINSADPLVVNVVCKSVCVLGYSSSKQEREFRKKREFFKSQGQAFSILSLPAPTIAYSILLFSIVFACELLQL